MQKLTLAALLLVGIVGLNQIDAHVRLLQPTSRASLWKFPEFQQYSPEVNVQDNELFCGGFHHQFANNGGKCGICGDPYDEAPPRKHEGGGLYGRGIIAATYTSGQVIDVVVELTASHLGYFEFKLCPQNNGLVPAEQSCLDQYPLKLADGSGSSRFYPTEGSKKYEYSLQLPEGVVCEFQCTLQLHYQTGNSWGTCEDGTGAIGCGDQENFRHCADIRIVA